MPETLPQTFGRFHIVEKLGEGGMGDVYLAEDTVLKRKVALKVPKFRPGDNGTVVQRFLREARLASQIEHPGLCPVHDVGCIDGVHYLALAYIEGTTLDRFVGPGQLWSPGHAIIIVRHLIRVLALLHDRGIIHRDLKPGNVMMRADGSPVLMDFGLARTFDASSQQLTTQGKAMGTPAFMAPEQVNGDESTIGPHTDVWALGVLLYQMLTGQLPFVGATQMEVWSRILHKALTPPSVLVPGLDPRLDAILARVLAKDPRQRPPTMAAFDRMLASLDAAAGSVMVTRINAANPQTTQSAYAIPTQSAVVSPTQTGRWPIVLATLAMLLTVSSLTVILLVWLGAFSPSGPGIVANASPQSSPAKPLPSVKLILPDEVSIIAGETQTIVVRVERSNFSGEVKLLRETEPDGIQLRLVAIAEDSKEATIQIQTTSNTKMGPHKVGLLARGPGKVEAEETFTVHVKIEENITNSIGMKLKLIPKGKFLMGASSSDRRGVEEHMRQRGDNPEKEPYKEWLDSEQPQHEVEITESFYLGVYEVTQEEYEKVMKANPSHFKKGSQGTKQGEPSDTRRFPVECVSWKDATEFCRTLSNLPEEKARNRTYRLPTEAEWEYACRGGSTSLFHHGDKLTYSQANFETDFPFDSTDTKATLSSPVAVDAPRYQANSFGLYHMHGNVWEWCSDGYEAKSYQTFLDKKLVQDPMSAPTMQNQFVLRGGAWSSQGKYCRSACRSAEGAESRLSVIGFRVVCVKSR